MGSGKTTVGRFLADQLGWQFVDLDTAIEARVGLSVPGIFASLGEEVFRQLEVDEFESLLVATDKVIALGGGAPGTAAIRELLRAAPHTFVVHLGAPFQLLYERCRLQTLDPQATTRPLLGDEAAAATRFERRLALYQAIAHWEADAAAGPPVDVASVIAKRVRGLDI